MDDMEPTAFGSAPASLHALSTGSNPNNTPPASRSICDEDTMPSNGTQLAATTFGSEDDSSTYFYGSFPGTLDGNPLGLREHISRTPAEITAADVESSGIEPSDPLTADALPGLLEMFSDLSINDNHPILENVPRDDVDQPVALSLADSIPELYHMLSLVSEDGSDGLGTFLSAPTR